jgi:hypothetical protein
MRRLSPVCGILFLTLVALLSTSCRSIPAWREKLQTRTSAWRQQLQPLLRPFQKPAPAPPEQPVAPPPPVAIRPPSEEQSEALPPSVSAVSPEIVVEAPPVAQKMDIALPGKTQEQNQLDPPSQDAERPEQTAPDGLAEEKPLKASEADKLGDSTHAIRIVSVQQGEVAPNTLLLVQPGETLEFQVQIAGPHTQTESEGVKTKTRTQAKTVLQQNRKETNDREAGEKPVVRRLFLKASKGQVVSSLPGQAVWQAPDEPGLQTLDFTIEEREPSSGKKSEARVARGQVRVQTLHPFNATESKEIEGFPIGQYPNEKSAEAKAAIQNNATSYTPPQWLVRVTPEVENLHVSPHFTLSELALRSEQGKEHFIALDSRLVSFLEALRTAAQSKYGEKARIGVLRGYMSPAERERLAGQGVQYVQFSRYQYGNCAAIYLDLTNSGKMSDLNKDGRVDVDDARALEELVRSVRAQRKETGWVGTFEKPLEPDWPQTPFTAFDVRPQTKR